MERQLYKIFNKNGNTVYSMSPSMPCLLHVRGICNLRTKDGCMLKQTSVNYQQIYNFILKNLVELLLLPFKALLLEGSVSCSGRLTCCHKELGIKPPTLRSVDGPLYQFSHNHLQTIKEHSGLSLPPADVECQSEFKRSSCS